MEKKNPTDKNKRICIVGPGAIGGVVAGVLAREGFDITLVTKYEELAEKISFTGLEVRGHQGNFIQPIPSTARINQMKGNFDYALIATRGDAMEESARELLPYLNAGSRVVSMQNGIWEPLLAGIVGQERTIGCVVGWRGSQLAPGKVEMTTGGECVLGNWNRPPDEKLEHLARIMGIVIETRIASDIFSEVYSKMVINSCITTLGVISGATLGEIMYRNKARKIFIEIVREAIQVAEAMKIKVAPAAMGRLNFYRFLAPGLVSDLKRHFTIWLIGIKYRKQKSSSLRNLERGLKTEVHNYNGYIASKGREFNVPTPVNEQLIRMVLELEQGKRENGPGNFLDVNLD